MMLPEHKEAIRRRQQGKQKRSKPELDEQMLAVFSQEIQSAYEQKTTVRMTLFHPEQTCSAEGTICKIDTWKKQLQLQTASSKRWISLEHIIELTTLR